MRLTVLSGGCSGLASDQGQSWQPSKPVHVHSRSCRWIGSAALRFKDYLRQSNMHCSFSDSRMSCGTGPRQILGEFRPITIVMGQEERVLNEVPVRMALKIAIPCCEVQPQVSHPKPASCQLLHRAAREPRRMKRMCNSDAASGKEVGFYLVPRTRMSVGPAASRAPRTVALGPAPLSTHPRVR